MLSTSLKIAILLGILLYFTILIILLRKKQLTLRYTLLWLFSGFVMLVFTLWPGLLSLFSNLVGIEIQSNALFAILFFCVLIILVSITSIISKQTERIKTLVQQSGQPEERIRQLENRKVQ